MYAWNDMSRVKKELWNKLHQAKKVLKDGVNNLAQVVSNSSNILASNVVQQLPDSVKLQLKQYYAQLTA